MTLILDVQKLRLLPEPESSEPERTLECDLLIAGGGLGGCAAALAASRSGRSVVLTEETDWLGGQMTSQGMSALEEHPFIETFGGTRSYGELRARIRAEYREGATLSAVARETPHLNPGNSWASRLSFEPRAGLRALEQLLGPFEASGRLVVLRRHRAVSAEVLDDRVHSVTFRHLDGPEHVRVRPAFVLDATEPGDLLPLVGAEYRIGAEGRDETGEPHALAGAADPERVQPFTYPFVLEHRPGERHYVRPPEGYASLRDQQPYALRHPARDTRGWVPCRMFAPAPGAGGPFWTQRRLVDAAGFEDARYAHDLALIHGPGNDFRHGSLLDVPPQAALEALLEARRLSLGFCYWLQSECPRDEGGSGYPELHLRPDVLDTADGLSRYPYLRESRRIVARRTVVETDLAAEWQTGARARLTPDSVGIGYGAIDFHPAEGEERLPPIETRPFQIPLAALVPARLKNLLPACKNAGLTQIAQAAFRSHPVEWTLGEAAALTAVFCLDRNLSPQTVLHDGHRRRRLQRRLVRAGVPLHWYVDVPPGHPAFEASQILAAWGVWTGDPRTLGFGPDEEAGPAELRALAEAPRWARGGVERLLAYWLPRWTSISRQMLWQSTYEMLCI